MLCMYSARATTNWHKYQLQTPGVEPEHNLVFLPVPRFQEDKIGALKVSGSGSALWHAAQRSNWKSCEQGCSSSRSAGMGCCLRHVLQVIIHGTMKHSIAQSLVEPFTVRRVMTNEIRAVQPTELTESTA